jgi:hypothetical protein
MVLGKLPRVNRRVGLVVLRKSATMSRSSAAFSKSIFSAAACICSSSAVIISRDLPSRNSHACATRSRYCSAPVSLKRTGTWYVEDFNSRSVGAPRPKVSTPNFLRMKFSVCRNAPACAYGPK